jgi:CRP/FNR family transcriptional regulator
MRRAAVCGALEVNELQSLEAMVRRARLAAGQVLFEEGGPADEVFTLTEGVLRLYKLLRDGRRQITGFLIPGDYLGLAFAGTYAYGAEAVTDVALCRFPRRAFLRLLDEVPALERELLSRAGNELALAQEQMLLLGRKTARERLASFLVGFAERRGVEAGRPVALPMSRADLGDYLGLTMETVSRAFTNLCDAGLIALPDKRHYVVRHHERLLEAAGA